MKLKNFTQVSKIELALVMQTYLTKITYIWLLLT